MPKRKRLGWYSFYKHSTNAIRAVIPNPPPINARPPVRLPCGALFFDRSPNDSTPPLLSPPTIPSRFGLYKTRPQIEEMRRLYSANPTQWSLSTLTRHFKVPRSFVINQVLTEEERKRLEKESEEMFVQSPLGRIKGALISARVRQEREKTK